MNAVFFIFSYLLAFIPAMLACFAICYLICALKLLYQCFGRPRASVHVMSHVAVFVVCAVLAGGTLRGLFLLGDWVGGYDPTLPVVLMFIFPGSTLYFVFPAHLREAERDLNNERSQWAREAAELEESTPLPRGLNWLFVPRAWRRPQPKSCASKR